MQIGDEKDFLEKTTTPALAGLHANGDAANARSLEDAIAREDPHPGGRGEGDELREPGAVGTHTS